MAALAALLWRSGPRSPETMYEGEHDEDGFVVVERRWARCDRGGGCRFLRPRGWMEATVAEAGPVAFRSLHRGHGAILAGRYTPIVTNRWYWRSGCHRNMTLVERNT